MTFDDMHDELFAIVSAVGARPDIPIEAYDYFSKLVAAHEDRDTCRKDLLSVVPKLFRSFTTVPEWLQEPEWPWSCGAPMVFVGSITPPADTFHDDGRFYVFWCADCADSRCVVQVA